MSQGLETVSPPELERAVLTSASLGPKLHQLHPRAEETTARESHTMGVGGTPQTLFTGQMLFYNLSLTFNSFLEHLPLFQKAHSASFLFSPGKA